jgi:hypothetical protein
MRAVPFASQSEASDFDGSSYANCLLGVWWLLTYSHDREDRDDTQPFGPNPQGFLIYTVDGFVPATSIARCTWNQARQIIHVKSKRIATSDCVSSG